MADSDFFGPMHMSRTRKYEVQRTNHFRLSLNIDNARDVELAVDSVGLPNITTEAIELNYGNSNVKVAGKSSFDDISISVKDFIEADIEAILYQWRKSVYNPKTDMVGWSDKYKKDGTIYQYGPDGTVLRSWQLLGVWPTNMEMGDLSYDGSDKKQITMQLSVDRAYPERENKTL